MTYLIEVSKVLFYLLAIFGVLLVVVFFNNRRETWMQDDWLEED